ncbi:MAG: hypothetical protein QOD43_127 [Gaiellaceae bacterium]|nr:hypothetical protein [Gaiellaceae bacterium]
MPPETAELIELIEAERKRVRKVLEEADADLKKADEISSDDLQESPEEAAAVETLRRVFG